MIFTLILFFLLALLVRNELVFKKRMEIVRIFFDNMQEHLKECSSIQELNDHKRVFNEGLLYLNSISYDKMLWCFWKPIKSFYDYSKLI